MSVTDWSSGISVNWCAKSLREFVGRTVNLDQKVLSLLQPRLTALLDSVISIRQLLVVFMLFLLVVFICAGVLGGFFFFFFGCFVFMGFLFVFVLFVLLFCVSFLNISFHQIRIS